MAEFVRGGDPPVGSVFSGPLEALVLLGYRFTDRVDQLVPLQKMFLQEVWIKHHPGRSP
jgi:hypothetical protein